MTLVTSADLLARCARDRTGIGAFNVITLEHAEGVLDGAERAGTAIIVQVSHNAVRFHRGRAAPLAAGLLTLADASSVDVALHLDHVEDVELLHEAPGAGFSSVMFDAGALGYDDNVAATTGAAAWAHEHGLLIEAELGYVGGKDTQPASAHLAGVRTDPEQAAAFVAATGVDALAVAVGSAHAMQARTAELDLDLVRRLRATVPVPLVLHGSSGVPDDQLSAGIRAGLTKINVGTLTATAWTRAIRTYLGQHPDASDPRKCFSAARDAVAAVVARLVAVIAGTPPPKK
jgi:fructose-bisphosphate aldolase class II